MGQRAEVRQSLRLDGKKVCNIKMFDISQAESNNIKACALPSIHLPLTREASVILQSKGECGFGRLCGEKGCVIIIYKSGHSLPA